MKLRSSVVVTGLERGRSVFPVLLLLTLCVAVGCVRKRVSAPSVSEAAMDVPAPAWQNLPEATRKAYLQALEIAQQRPPAAISTELLPLLPSTDGLLWDSDGRILMVTWTRLEYYREADPETGRSTERFRRGDRFPLHGDTWFTAAPSLQNWCRRLGLAGGMLNLRIRQRLGLPPDDEKDAFLHVWVDPSTIFRPCPDPEISDRECQLEIALVDRNQDVPWDCTPGKKQRSGSFVEVKPAHLDWMCANWKASYGNPSPNSNYPWTALGYTFDWGNPGDPRGPSEFVALAQTEVQFEKIVTTADFCQVP